MENKMHHVMIDSETLGLTPGAVIRTVSAVEFEPETGNALRKKTWTISLADSLAYGFGVEAGTLKWWMTRSEEARKAFVAEGEEEYSVNSFISDFENWFAVYNGNVTLWGLQVDFDAAAIRCYLAAYYMRKVYRKDSYILPWNRTHMIEVRPYWNAYKKEVQEEHPHVSMNDCMQQICAVRYCIANGIEIKAY